MYKMSDLSKFVSLKNRYNQSFIFFISNFLGTEQLLLWAKSILLSQISFQEDYKWKVGDCF